jgi:hypothetical protein
VTSTCRLTLLTSVLVLHVLAPSDASSQTWRLGPDRFSLRHPTSPSIEIWSTGADLPTLRFFEAPDLSGNASLVIDAAGLTLDGRRRCRWLAFDAHSRLLGLQYGKDGLLAREPECPEDLPISTHVTDAGFGQPALFIVISRISGLVGQIRYRTRTFYFDLHVLPGNPREDEPPPFRLPSRSGPGWAWLESQRTKDRQDGAALARRLEDSQFARFYHGIRACLLHGPPPCLDEYLDPSFSLTPWWSGSRDKLGGRGFGRVAWQTAPNGPHDSSLWQELAWCLLRGRWSDESLSFHRGFFLCQVAQREGRYGLVSCDVSE